MADSEHSNANTNAIASSDASVTMKTDGSPDDGCNQENTKNEKREEEVKICSPTNRPSTNSITTTTNPFAPSFNKTTNILKPPHTILNNTNNKSTKSFILCPSRLSTVVKKTDDSNSSDKKTQINGEAPKFVPLIESTTQSTTATTTAVTTTTTTTLITAAVVATTNSTTPTSSTNLASSFVFGQNLRDRVIVPSIKITENDKTNDEPEPSTSVINSNGTSEMLFSSAIKNEKRIENNTSTSTATTTTTQNKEMKTLSESAREYEESRANKRKYEQVEVVTGEEGETNILNITCKLFAFDKGSWQERGRGILRLNDLETDENQIQSRLVFRCTGNFRVVLNTKIWAEMTVEKASEKSVRFTALDPDGEIKIFLAMASIDDARHLFTEIQNRVQKVLLTQKHKKLHTSSTTTTDKE